MPRTKHGVPSKSRKKKILKRAKGYFGSRHTLYRPAREAVNRALIYAYRDRRARKRDFRKLWIARINAAARLNGLSYNRLIDGLKKSNVDINRKVLAELALNDAAGFTRLAEIAKESLS
jgi:large subunit ribosomal protein L20